MSFRDQIRKFWSPMVWGNLLAMCIVAGGVLAGVWWWLGEYTRHGEEIEVPNVTNRMLSDAVYTLELQGLTAAVADSAHDSRQPIGCVLHQLPASGSHVKAGREIRLTINSSHVSTMQMPDIADNCSLREAQDRLNQLGFTTTVQYVHGDRDWVYGVIYQGRTVNSGERIPAEAHLILQVGSGYGEDKIDTLGNDADAFDYE